MKISIISLGCEKNTIDSEVIAGILVRRGYEIATLPSVSRNDKREEKKSKCDVVIINTCAFIKDAQKEAYGTIKKISDLKRVGEVKKIIVAGCLAKKEKNSLFEKFPQIDVVFSSFNFDEITSLIDINKYPEQVWESNILMESSACRGKAPQQLGESDRICHTELVSGAQIHPQQVEGSRDIKYNFEYLSHRVRSTPPWLAYIKIAEGCNNNCSYCLIPKLRGKYISRNLSSIVDEVKKSADEGVKEIILVAHDVTAYGSDFKPPLIPPLEKGGEGGFNLIKGEYKENLKNLLLQLDKINGIKWIRLLYLNPSKIDDELIELISQSKKICHYFEIPIQHIDNDILKSMNRKITGEKIKELIYNIRNKIKDAAIRTTVIVGFPGESEDKFASLLNFVKEIKFDKLGAFIYSKEKGTKAYNFDMQISNREKKRRYDIIMQEQQKISYEINKTLIDKNLEVLIEKYVINDKFPMFQHSNIPIFQSAITNHSTYAKALADKQLPIAIGRSYREAPEIDGNIYIGLRKGTESLPCRAGGFYKVKIKKAGTYDLFGEALI